MTTPPVVCTRQTMPPCSIDVQYSFGCDPQFERRLRAQQSGSDRPAGQQAHARDDTPRPSIAAAAIATCDLRR